MGWFGESFGWLFGSKENCKAQRDAGRPQMQEHETEIDYAKTVLSYEVAFNRSYWTRAYFKRTAIVVIVVMALTNPSFDSFKRHVKTEYGFTEDMCQQNFNAFLFKKFAAHGHSFIGAFDTFFALSGGEAQIIRVVSKQDSVYKDPTKKRDTFKKFLPLPLPASLDTAADREFHPAPPVPGQPQQQQQLQPDTTHF